MTTVTLPRATVEQALEALEYDNPAGRTATITALRAALAEPTGKESLQVESVVAENATTQQQIEQTPPSEYRRGYWDGFRIGKREGRIEAEDEPAQQAEPVQEPVAWQDTAKPTELVCAEHWENIDPVWHSMYRPLYTAPPQRKPLTQEEIPALAEQVLKLSVYYDVWALLGTDGLVALVRAVERAHGIKE